MYQMSIMLLCTAYEPSARVASGPGGAAPSGRAFPNRSGFRGEALGDPGLKNGGGRRPARLEAHPEADERAPHERARVARQDPPGVEHDAEIHARADALEAQALLDGQEDLADPEEPDDRDDEVESLHQVHEPERHPELTRDDVEPYRREDEPEQDRDERLERVADAQPDEAREGQELDREEFGRAELEGDRRQERG